MDWNESPKINDSKSFFESYGALNSVLRCLPVSATRAFNYSGTDVTNTSTVKGDCRENSKNAANNSSSNSSQSSPGNWS